MAGRTELRDLTGGGRAPAAVLALTRQFLAQLLDHPLSRAYLRGLGVQFVERFAARQSVEDARRLADPIRAGTSVALFPEGTFRRMPGLASFHLGAFAAAVAAGVPVLPVSIRGTRTILPAGRWLPRRGTIAVTIGSPVFPSAWAPNAFASAVALRDSARAHGVWHLFVLAGSAIHYYAILRYVV